MTGDQLYDLTKATIHEQRSPGAAYYRTKLIIKIHLMEQVEQPVIWRWKRRAA